MGLWHEALASGRMAFTVNPITRVPRVADGLVVSQSRGAGKPSLPLFGYVL